MAYKTVAIAEDVQSLVRATAKIELREMKTIVAKAMTEYAQRHHPELVETCEVNLEKGLRAATR